MYSCTRSFPVSGQYFSLLGSVVDPNQFFQYLDPAFQVVLDPDHTLDLGQEYKRAVNSVVNCIFAVPGAGTQKSLDVITQFVHFVHFVELYISRTSICKFKK